MNDDQLIYPSEDDIVDINVLNNNFKYLNKTKLSISDLADVARESSPKNIESKVVSTHSSVNSVQNTVNTMNSTINNISSVVNSINNKSNIKSVQRGVATLALNSNYVTTTISLSSVNVNKCITILNGQTNGITSVGQVLNFEPYVESLSNSQLKIAFRNTDRHSGSGSLYASWQVIEFY